jgi:hypothetical protein
MPKLSSILIFALILGSCEMGERRIIDGSVVTDRDLYALNEIAYRRLGRGRLEVISGERMKERSDREQIVKCEVGPGKNVLLADSMHPEKDAIRIYYDKGSFKRYHFSISDVLGIFQEIEEKRYRSIFEQPLLGFLKKMHELYGTKVTLFLFYENGRFNLSLLSERYREELHSQAEWLKLGFHARNEKAFPYSHASFAEGERDFLMIRNEVFRFAGVDSWSNVVRSGYCSGSREAVRAWKKNGAATILTCRPYTGLYYLSPGSSRIGAMWGALKRKLFGGDVFEYIFDHDYWIDFDEGLTFVTLDVVIEQDKEIIETLQRVCKIPRKSEIIDVATHEWALGNEDNLKRVDQALNWLKMNGYVPVFYCEGFLGNASISKEAGRWGN